MSEIKEYCTIHNRNYQTEEVFKTYKKECLDFIDHCEYDRTDVYEINNDRKEITCGHKCKSYLVEYRNTPFSKTKQKKILVAQGNESRISDVLMQDVLEGSYIKSKEDMELIDKDDLRKCVSKCKQLYC